jgi:long-chain fatty acid transport protein
MEQSGKELGQAFAGATTNTEDGSAVFFNPGALGRFSGRQLTVAGHLVSPSIRFHDEGSRLALPVGGAPLTGGDGGDAGQTIFVPNFYYVQEIGPRLVFGLGLNAPFGLHTDYDPDWKGRYHSITAELQTVSLRPALALRIGKHLSVGGTIAAQYAYARLSNAIDFGTLCLASLPPPTCGRLGLAPQRADGRFEVEGDDLAWGYGLGALYAFNDDTRIGVSYRSAIDQDIEGDAEFTVPHAALPLTRGGTLFTNTGARTDLALPDSVALGVFHRLHPRWTVAADVLWMRWSRFKELRIRFDSAQPDTVSPQQWEDTVRYALGLSWQPRQRLTLRMGVAYDESPVPSPQFRSPIAPDSDRFWLAAGASYRVSASGTVHLGYAHLFVHAPHVDNPSLTGDTLTGRYQGDIDVLSLQLDWRF